MERGKGERLDLDSLYYNRSSAKFLKAYRTFPILFNLTQRQLEKKVVDDLRNGGTGIHRELYKAYSDNLQKAVGGVLNGGQYGDKYFDLQQQLQANVSRFAAFKAYHATQQIDRQRADKDGVVRSDADYEKNARAVLNAFNRYQVAEHNTAMARARTAKQFTDFRADPVRNELHPNLKWLPSRSANPREEHVKLYGIVLPKNHPFWQSNQPGNLWQCKCDIEETDEATFSGEIPKVRAQKGLEGNPADTGEIFTEQTTYLQMSKSKRKEVDGLAFDIQKKQTIENGKYLYEKTVKQKIEENVPVEIEFNSRGLKHFADDMKNDSVFYLKNEMIHNLDKYIENAEFVAYESNTKKVTKPTAETYYYYKFKFANGATGYLGVEKNSATGKYILYTVTKKLRKTAISV
ncbi:MAG: hypothetical protein LBN27_01780 [Prevotellaceae bacterium]|nr:hypothetical protein [Prevotellaceae bacterium]